MSKYTADDAQAISSLDHVDFADGEEVGTIECDEGRWHRWMVTIVKDNDDQHWGVSWGRGLTESQDHDFSTTPYMVDSREVVIPARTETHWFVGASDLGELD